ncbi:hypothetical protein TGAM01_v206560 [Trichoderma gamsii]|uniref:BTB domain-containing protein n=1 Tax=Trichoderma gamsii TaxID=398673 RepID=A0A2P4ZK07_9HYPO|nr:hypothetical protein TGAM01_v206560 [Trichoderma gamsii]PON24630.1 hypothetical protein TGAM01_v206560 [Trichoderma gamsii]
MEPTMHVLDPEGDTLLTLASPNPPFVTSYSLWRIALPQYNTWETRNKERLLWTAPDESVKIFTTDLTIKMQLSSKHLKLASDYFRTMMAGNNWKESTPKDGFSFSVTANGWNEEALLTVMRILHGRTKVIPRTISLEKLAKIAVVIDYYNLHEAIDFSAKEWIYNLKEPPPTSFGRTLLLRFLVSWVFSEVYTFRQLSKIIIQESRGPVNAQSLPIPKAIIDALDQKRQELVSGVISGLESLQGKLREIPGECVFDCSAMTLGALMIDMKTMGLDPLPKSPFHGYSFMTLKECVENIQEPSYNHINHKTSQPVRQSIANRYEYSKPEPRSCSLMAKINSIINEQLGKIDGLDLNSFIDRS